MNGHPDFEELQDFREGLLTVEGREEVASHLDACSACRADLEALAELMDGMAELPVEAEPSRDLWPQIQWRIQGSETRRPEPSNRKGITVQAWQLLAAGLVLTLLSGGLVWAFMSATLEGPPSLAREGAPLDSPVAFASEYAAYDEYTDAVTELEGVVDEGREYLDPETIRVLEENLTIIDRAILESTEALAQDPGSRILRRLLSETMRRKLNLLQKAAEIIVANT